MIFLEKAAISALNDRYSTRVNITAANLGTDITITSAPTAFLSMMIILKR